MKKKLCLCVMIGFMIMTFQVGAQAAMIDIADDTLTHFASFTNDAPATTLNRISTTGWATAVSSNFGWHHSPSGSFPQNAGLLLGSTSYAVSTLRLQVHQNPFKDFVLEGSSNTTTGQDGTWTALLSSTVTERREGYMQEWNFANTTLYSAYRINMLNDYVGGWAMYRWDLIADDSITQTPVPEPATVALLGIGLTGLAGAEVRRRRKKKAVDKS